MAITSETSGGIEARPFESVRRAARTLVSQYLTERRERLTEIQIKKLSERVRQDLGLHQTDSDFHFEQSSRR